jgi:hypothetical protein
VSKIERFKFTGGPNDGLELENGLGFIPDVIDGKAFHMFGASAYAVMMINWDEGYAVFEPIKLVNLENDTGTSRQRDDV